MSAFARYRCAQHVESKWRGSLCARYQTYLIPKNHSLLDAIPFAYEESTHAKSRENEISVRKVASKGEMDVDAENSKETGSKNSDENNSKSPDFNMEIRSILDHD